MATPSPGLENNGQSDRGLHLLEFHSKTIKKTKGYSLLLMATPQLTAASTGRHNPVCRARYICEGLRGFIFIPTKDLGDPFLLILGLLKIFVTHSC